MAPLDVPPPCVMTVLLVLLALPLTLHACPRSCSCPTPREVHCAFRHLTSAPRNMPKDTEKVNIGYNSIQAVGASDFTDLRRLEMLMLHGNDIMTVSPGALYNLRSLQILKLSYNKLKTIKPKMFEGLSGLVRLHLDHNLIEFIEPLSFNGLTSLKLLQLEGNLLRDLHPHTFVTFSFLGTFWSSSLRHLHLADNQLEYLLPETLQHLGKLELLSLHGNPWTCDCQLRWLIEWHNKNNGVIKCKKDRDSGASENCSTCSSPQNLNNSQLLQLSPERLSCQRPAVQSPLKLSESPGWEEAETKPDHLRSEDLESPLGHLTFVLSDSHGNRAHVLCSVKRPDEITSVVWQALKAPGQVSVNVTLMTQLECEIDRDELQRLWRLVAYYYESPAILERGLRKGYNDSTATFQYEQSASEDTPYFTELKGHLTAEPEWLLQPRVTLQLNRRMTTTKKLVLEFTTFISEQVNVWGDQEDSSYAWAIIQRRDPERIQFGLEDSQASLKCKVKSLGQHSVEWMLPNLSILKESTARLVVSEEGTLVIDNASQSDSGLYHCIVRTENYVDVVSFRLIVRELLLSPDAINGKPISVDSGTSLTIPCSVSSVKPSGISWYLPSYEILQPAPPKERVYVSTNGSLVIEEAMKEDSGEYSCLAGNIYGVDMLSHLITIEGNKDTELPSVSVFNEDSTSADSRTGIKLSEESEEEGSGYLEIKQPNPAQTPHSTSGRLDGSQGHFNQGHTGKRVKESDRKSNKSVKELDPNRWAQFLEKTNAKSSTDPSPRPMMTTMMTTEETTTPTPTTTTTTTITPHLSSHTPLPATGTTSTTTSATTTTTITMPNLINTRSSISASEVTPDESTEKQTELEFPKKVNDFDHLLPPPTPYVTAVPKHQTMPVHSEVFPIPTPYQLNPNPVTVGYTDNVHVTLLSTEVTRQEPPPDRHIVQDRKETTSNSNGTQRWRPPHRRRRPPYRRIRPISSSKNIPPPSPDRMQVTISPFSTNSEKHESIKSKNADSSQMLDSNKNSPGNPKLSSGSTNDNSGTEEKVTAASPLNLPIEGPGIKPTEKQMATINPMENSYRTQTHHASSTYFPLYHDTFKLSTKPPVAKQETTALLSNNRLHVSQPPSQERKQWNENKEDSIASADTDVQKSPWILTAKDTSHYQKKAQIVPTLATSTLSPSLTTTVTVLLNNPMLSRGEDQLVNVSPAVPIHNPAQTYIQPNRETETKLGTPGPSSRNPTYVHRLRDSLPNLTNRQKEDSSKTRSENPNPPVVPAHHPWVIQQHAQKKLNTPNTQTTSTHSSSWVNRNLFPAWPSIHGSRHYPSSPSRTWHFPYPREKDAGVTNRPEITALTAKPTASIPESASPARGATTPQTSRPPLNTFHNRTREFSFLSRLRNRYRQSQLDAYRLSQSGKTVTPKPRVDSPFPKFQKPPTIPKAHSPVTPAFVPWAPNRPQATPSVLHDSRLHFSHWGPKKPSTALPFPDLTGGGERPRITSVNTVSMSALAETDVFLPCESSGEPAPALSWTKVSTGATIQANTKHGQRFEVLKNGTFVIKNVQLQDRGQYLCTAQNKFGSDRMVITLAVLTQPPKIVPPNPTDISVYLGRSLNLDCLAEGKPKAQISWILPDRTFVQEAGLPDSRAMLLTNGTLRIQAVNFSSKGNYKCIASNAAGADTVTYHIHVAALPPTIKEVSSETITIHTGRSIYVHCTVKGEPAPVLKWNLPSGAQIKPSQFLGSRFFIFPNGTLFVRSLSLTDSGKYECSATNAVGTARRGVQLDIRQESSSPPRSVSQQHRVTAMYGSTVYLTCQESTSTKRGALWRLPSKTLLDHRYSPDRSITAFPNGTLRIQQLTGKDGGTYVCMFQRPNGEDMEIFQVEVLMKPPKIETLGSAQKRVTHGENFQVDCVASGLPDPELSWSLPDGTMINNALQSDDSGARSRRYVMFENGTLLLQQMGKKDEGDYTCYAKNTLGEDEMRVSIRVVADSPRILFKDQSPLWGRLEEPVYMKCEARGDPPPTIIWLSPTNEIISSSSARYQLLGDGTLVIRKVSFADRGKYACVARNSAGDDIKNVKLEVVAREPQINGQRGRNTKKVLAVSYQTMLLDCRAEGMPEPRITWTTSYGMSLPTPYLGGRFQVHQNGSLELRGLRKTDEGQFVCLAKNNLGEARLDIQLEVAALAEKPSFLVPNIEVLPLRLDGTEVTLECQARGKPLPEFVWVLPNSTVLTPGTKLQRFLHYPSNGTLRISHPVTGDKGVYRCLAKNVAGQAEKRYILEPGRKPQIRGTSGPTKVSFGQSLNLPCTVDGWPQATISWTLPSGMVLDKPEVIGRVTYFPNGTLQLRETATFDRGTYTCKATNTFGSSTLSYPVAVMVYPPRITNAPPSITRVNRGSSVKLSCVAAGIPKPDISWTLPGRTTLVPSNRFAAQGGVHMTVEGSLVIQNPVLMNSGIYKCNAKSALGTDFKATYLQVL
ncbi:matrix-remodeling-associated protein 5 [Anguilla rostrata]|uniref:matrix-remodeling-associated protein 5 n=1 Tax=Anguilla rostrata TaxID=7938 RepID=UPI0030CE1DB5